MGKYIEEPNPLFTNCPLVFVVIVIMIMIQDAPVIGCMTILSGRAGPGNVPQPDEEIAKALIVKAKLLKECDESGEGLEEGERDRQGPKIGQICVKVRDEKRYLHIMQILMVRRVRKQTLEIM